MRIEPEALSKAELAQEIAAAPCRYEALGEHVIILPLSPDERTQGGIIVPDIAREKPQEGRVLSIGDDVGGDFEVGSLVLYGKYSGHEITETVTLEDGTRHDRNIIVLPEKGLLAVVNPSR